MHVDFFTLAALTAELQEMKDAKIQQVVQPAERVVALELYAGQRATLLLDVTPGHARALLQDEKARRGLEAPTPLGLLLRKYVRGGRLRAVRQPAWERVLELEIENEEGRSILVAEIMGRHSNLLLLDAGRTIRECVLRAGEAQNPYRSTLPNHPYVPPPPIDKRPPTALDAGDWRMMLTAAEPTQPLYRLLLRELAGVSPTLAREMATRATGEPTAPIAEAEAEAMLDVVAELFAPLRTGEWEPHVALDDSGQVIAFAPYELCQFQKIEAVATISEAMQRFFEARLSGDAYAAVRQRAAALLAKARSRVESTLYGLRSQHVPPEEAERLRENGELLLAYQWQVQRGAASVEVPDYEGALRRIPLDPTLSPVENAQRLFARYDKKKRAAEEIPPRIAQAEQDLAFLDTLVNDLAQAEERPEIDAVREALVAGSFVPSKKRRRGDGVVRGPRRVHLDGWVALVGRNAQQNDEVTFRHAASDDLWLHARGVPGSHVILKNAGRDLPEPTILRAAALAAYYCQARGSTEVAVDVTERRHVQRVSGARPGLVTYRNERTVHVKPQSAEAMETSE